MLLVDILARELKKWPSEAKIISQDANGCAHPYSYAGAFDGKKWLGPVQSCIYRVKMPALASDHATAIVTRADWQAAKEKLEGKAVKKPNANKDGWVRHRGGKCPVDAGTLVDVRYRNGDINLGVSALTASDDKNHVRGSRFSGSNSLAICWSHDRSLGDIMAYRIHTPSEQPAAAEETSPVEPVAQISGPLQWRDRITEIDAESKAENERHNAAMGKLNSERADLVHKLASEGLAMIERKAEPVDDMSDWRNWKAGDVITCNTDEWSRVYTKGNQYKVKASNPLVVFDDCGPGSACTIEGNDAEEFTFHSRPTN
jgi:hypothetical protein